VSPQHGTENWENEESCYRSLTTNIYRSPTCLKYFRASDIIAKYGIAVEVGEPIGNVRHAWFVICVSKTDGDMHTENSASFIYLSPPDTLLGGC